MNDAIDVSVICLTYNHEEFIKDTLNGFLQQETNLNIEYIINDDASTDKTSEIIEEFIKKNKHLRIKYIRAKVNEYSQGKNPGVRLLHMAKGKYTSLCEGDDFWIDKDKLQKQYDFLEEHNDYSICIHPSYVLVNGRMNLIRNKCRSKYSNYDVMREGGGIYSTSSAFYRSSINKRVAEKIKAYDKIPGDLIKIVEASRYGFIHCINEVMSVYRVHNLSVTHNKKIKSIHGMKKYISQLEDYYLDICKNDKVLNKIMQCYYYSYECNIRDSKAKIAYDSKLGVYYKIKLWFRRLVRNIL